MEGHDVKKWSIRDIIDLEYFFHKDAVSQSAEDQQNLNEETDVPETDDAGRPALLAEEGAPCHDCGSSVGEVDVRCVGGLGTLPRGR